MCPNVCSAFRIQLLNEVFCICCHSFVIVRERIIKEKPIVCIGEQWGELWQLFAYYNETVVDNPSLLKIVNSYDEAIECIENLINTF